MILDEIDRFLARFVAFPSDQARHAVTLWAAHTHLLDAFENTPRLILSSPEKQSGKTRTLEVLDLLVPAPELCVSPSAAVLFRIVGAAHNPKATGPLPTILLDEYDTIFLGVATERSEDVRSLVNSGHRRGATVPRCDGPTHQPIRFQIFAPVALAGIGDLPDTITDRAVTVRMRRRSPTEQVDPFRLRDHENHGIELRDHLADWSGRRVTTAETLRPDLKLPDGTVLADRPADVWEPLLAVADLAGGDWPRKARMAAQTFAVAPAASTSRGTELLRDIRARWPAGEPAVPASRLLGLLTADPDLRWSEDRGHPLTASGLSRLLGLFGIRSHRTRSARLYELRDFEDAWSRYLPPLPSPSQPSQTSQASPDVPQPVTGTVETTRIVTPVTPMTAQREPTADRVPANPAPLF